MSPDRAAVGPSARSLALTALRATWQHAPLRLPSTPTPCRSPVSDVYLVVFLSPWRAFSVTKRGDFLLRKAFRRSCAREPLRDDRLEIMKRVPRCDRCDAGPRHDRKSGIALPLSPSGAGDKGPFGLPAKSERSTHKSSIVFGIRLALSPLSDMDRQSSFVSDYFNLRCEPRIERSRIRLCSLMSRSRK